MYIIPYFEDNVFPLHSFVFVLLLFELEVVIDKLLMQALICIVDAQLFKRIALEDLEAKNVEYPEERLHLVTANSRTSTE